MILAAFSPIATTQRGCSASKTSLTYAADALSVLRDQAVVSVRKGMQLQRAMLRASIPMACTTGLQLSVQYRVRGIILR